MRWFWLLALGAGRRTDLQLDCLLTLTKHHRCKNQLDHFYGLLGLVESDIVKDIIVNSTAPPRDILRTFVVGTICHLRSLDLLADRDPHDRSTNLPRASDGPSWLCDWIYCYPGFHPLRRLNEDY